MVHFTMTPSYSVVSVFGTAIQDQFILALKGEEKKREKELVALQEHMESFKDETDSLWRTHAISSQTILPTPIPSCRQHHTVSVNSESPQEYKAD